MGKSWDSFVPGPSVWKEINRVLKPGANLLTFGGTRTQDLLSIALRMGKFEIRECIMYCFGSGFPKSYSISKGIDKRRVDSDTIVSWLKSLGTKDEISKAANVTPRQVDHWLGESTPCPQTPTEEKFIKICKHFNSVPSWADEMYEKIGDKLGQITHSRSGGNDFAKRPGSKNKSKTEDITAPATEEAEKWEGYGTNLKPAYEIIIAAQKPKEIKSHLEDIVYHIGGILCQLQLSVKIAEKNLRLNRPELREDANIVQWIAERTINIQDVLCALMDTLRYDIMENTNLSIVLYWLNILEEIYYQKNTLTTEMETNLITDLKILKSIPWEDILANIIDVKKINQSGFPVSVRYVDALFNAVKVKMLGTQTLFTPESATLKERDLALHPNYEPIILARKKIDKSIVNNCLKYGTGGLNIDGCRVEYASTEDKKESITKNQYKQRDKSKDAMFVGIKNQGDYQPQGRYPANLILDGSEEVLECFPETGKSVGGQCGKVGMHRFRNDVKPVDEGKPGYGDIGSAARYFYTAKVSKKERNAGLSSENNDHPTLKPISLTEYLAKLILPPERETPRKILVPFSGTGSEIIGALLAGWDYVYGIELDEKYVSIAKQRIDHYIKKNNDLIDLFFE